MFELRYTGRALKDLRKLDKSIAGRVLARAELLRTDPRSHGSTPLTDNPPYRRAREGNIRIKYVIDDENNVVTVARVLPRDKVYKRR